jgi:hypothetical protein
MQNKRYIRDFICILDGNIVFFEFYLSNIRDLFFADVMGLDSTPRLIDL